MNDGIKNNEGYVNKNEAANFAQFLACINGGELSDEAASLLNDCVDGKKTTEEALEILKNKYQE